MTTEPLRGGMPYPDFLNAAIDDALESVREHESRPSRRHFREGAEAGLEACRDLAPAALRRLAEASEAESRRALTAGRHDEAAIAAHWYSRSRAAQIAWICNIVHAAEDLSGRPTRYPTTVRGVIAAASILGLQIPGLHGDAAHDRP